MYEIHQMKGERRRSFAIALPRARGQYTSDFAGFIASNNDYHQTPHLGVLILDYLKGAGTLIDVGANIGLLSIPAAVYGSNVVAIELLPENCLYLTLAVLENRLKNIRLFQLAAGDERRMAAFAGIEASGHVIAPGQGPPAMMLPLDDIVALANLQGSGRLKAFVRAPLLVKIDTEGYELPVLTGAPKLIAQLDPVFIVECIMVEGRGHPADRRTRKVKTLLQQNGYHLYLHRAHQLVPHAASDLQEGHVCDIFASRRHYRDGERIGRFTVGPLSLDFSYAASFRSLNEAVNGRF